MDQYCSGKEILALFYLLQVEVSSLRNRRELNLWELGLDTFLKVLEQRLAVESDKLLSEENVHPVDFSRMRPIAIVNSCECNSSI
jgi:hypothetical protein